MLRWVTREQLGLTGTNTAAALHSAAPAEGLACHWAKVSTEFPTPGQSLARKRAWGNFSIGGSRGIRESQNYVRKGGANARLMLVQAADQWKVPARECRAANSVITHKPSGRRATCSQVAAAAGKLSPPAQVTLKDARDWELVGPRLARLDTLDKVTGRQIHNANLTPPWRDWRSLSIQ